MSLGVLRRAYTIAKGVRRRFWLVGCVFPVCAEVAQPGVDALDNVGEVDRLAQLERLACSTRGHSGARFAAASAATDRSVHRTRGMNPIAPFRANRGDTGRYGERVCNDAVGPKTGRPWRVTARTNDHRNTRETVCVGHARPFAGPVGRPRHSRREVHAGRAYSHIACYGGTRYSGHCG